MKYFDEIEQQVVRILRNRLPVSRYYHSVGHTLDVLRVCNEYIDRQSIDLERAQLLRTGALLHDIGFTVSDEEHEEHGVRLAEGILPEYEVGPDEIRLVSGLIRATKIPQSPATELEKILCDADLDYLGRDDFYEIGDHLFRELQAYDMVNTRDEWNAMQIRFLEGHQYHTEFARKERQPRKEERIGELKTLLS